MELVDGILLRLSMLLQSYEHRTNHPRQVMDSSLLIPVGEVLDLLNDEAPPPIAVLQELLLMSRSEFINREIVVGSLLE